MLQELHSCSKFKATKGLKWQVKEWGRGAQLEDGRLEMRTTTEIKPDTQRADRDWFKRISTQKAHLATAVFSSLVSWPFDVWKLHNLTMWITSIGWAFNGFLRLVWKTSTGHLIWGICFHLADCQRQNASTDGDVVPDLEGRDLQPNYMELVLKSFG